MTAGARGRTRRVEIGVAGRIRDDIGDRHAERLVKLIRHLVTVGELPASRMSREHDGLEIRKHRLVRRLLQDLVGEVVRRVIFPSLSAIPPERQLSPLQGQLDLVGGQRVLTARLSRRKARCDDERVVERVREKCGGNARCGNSCRRHVQRHKP